MWYDFYKLFVYSFKPDPLSLKQAQRQADGVGVTQPDAIPDIRQDGSFWGGGKGVIRLRDTNDFVDLSSVTNRQSRYKEYERLRSVAEIESALTIFSDESCLSGDTLIATAFGMIPIRELAEKKKPDERFLVYCFDQNKQDYTLGWAFNARKTKTAETINVCFDNGSKLTCTPDHKLLLRNGMWAEADSLEHGDELMPFYRLPASPLSKCKTSQFPRILTLTEGWKHERQFVDEWRLGKQKDEYDPRCNQLIRYISSGLSLKDCAKLLDVERKTVDYILRKSGFSGKEIKHLTKRYKDRRRIIGFYPAGEMDVYDLSVEDYHNFATDQIIAHNCQRGDNNHTFEIKCNNDAVKKELEFLFHKLLKTDRKIWNWAKNLYLFGDFFLEVVIDPMNPKAGILKLQPLPPDSIFRIETTKGKLLEYQQSKEGPDYQSLSRVDVTKATDQDLAQATAIRFAPEQIIHLRIGDDRKTFYPYGVSLIEAARGPAHQLRLMEDAMVVYRLCLAGNSRIRTHDGYKYIKDIKSGDSVFTLQRDNTITATDVIWTVNNGVHPTYKVKSKHIEIVGTATHPVLVCRDGVVQYVDIQDLIPKKDKLLNITRDEEIDVEITIPELTRFLAPKNFIKEKLSVSDKDIYDCVDCTNFTTKKSLQCAKNSVKGFLNGKNTWGIKEDVASIVCAKFNIDLSQLRKSKIKYKKTEKLNLPKYVDDEFARLFGFMLGYGGVRKKGMNQNSLYFITGQDQVINEKYRKLLEKYFGESVFVPDKRSIKGFGKYCVYSLVACDTMRQLGFTGDKYTKRIPSWAFTAPKNIRRALIEGLSDADGCERYTKAGTWFSTIELCNEKLTEDVKELWHSIGLCSGKLGCRQRKGGHEIEPGRKMKDTVSYLITISDCILPKYENIWSVTYEKDQEVYDFTVNHPEHNFIVNGSCTKNTRAPERRVFYIDVGQLPPNRAEAFIERMKDQFRKKKVYSNKSASPTGASAVEERWHAPAADEDYWIPIRPQANTRIETLPGACLALDTEIPLLDGRTLSLTDIIKEYENSKQLWAYSCNPETGEFAPGLISWAGVTRKNTQVVKVTLDNGESIVCTPDHKFPVIGKGNIEAQHLSVGQSLIPWNTRLASLQPNRPSKYLQIYDTNNKQWEFVHRAVAGFVSDTKYRCEMVHSEQYKDAPKNVIHHKNYDHFDNTPENLAWMNWDDHALYHRDCQEATNANISAALTKYHQNLTNEEKAIRDEILKKRSVQGSSVLLERLQDHKFNLEFRERQKEGWAKAKVEKPELHKARGEKISERNKVFWSNQENKKLVFGKQTVVYPKPLMDFTMKCFANGMFIEETVEEINKNSELKKMFLDANTHIKRKNAINLDGSLKPYQMTKMVKAHGYKHVEHARKEAKLYNHKVVSVEWLDEKVDTGTLTIDGKHEIHNYHNFAVKMGIMVKNSNLGEIDDALYFRNKLFIALQLPKNYLAQDDPQQTKVTLSSQDVKFARFIERLQMSLADGFYEIADRHLTLRGFPPELWDDIEITCTPPSEWREISRQEVITARYTNASTLKSAQLMADYDIYVDILKIPEDVAKVYVQRNKMQKIEDMKIQVMGQNPDLLGVGQPGQGDLEMGGEAGGPNPMLTGQQPPAGGGDPNAMGGMPPGGAPQGGAPGAPPGGAPPMPPPDSGMDGLQPPPQGGPAGAAVPPESQPLPEPDEKDIRKYDLSIQDYSKEKDEEENDAIETGEH